MNPEGEGLGLSACPGPGLQPIHVFISSFICSANIKGPPAAGTLLGAGVTSAQERQGSRIGCLHCGREKKTTNKSTSPRGVGAVQKIKIRRKDREGKH